MARDDIDSFSTFLGSIDPEVAQEQMKHMAGEFDKTNDDLTEKVIEILKDRAGPIPPKEMADELKVSVIELAKVLDHLHAQKRVRIDGVGDSETIELI
ncbi:MAG TPA: hypothetical protein VG318_04305 [Actinomycetota bacterium]|nr:hypothetical protein [Actinomycetota bacterium]